MNCRIFKIARAFDLILTLRARPKYQLSSSIFVQDYTQQNRWDYTQQNRDWEALENPQIKPFHPNFEKTTMFIYTNKYISKIVRPRSTKKYLHIKPL